MAEKPEPRKRKSPRNFAKQIEQLVLYCKVSMEVLEETPSDFNKGKIAAYKAVLARLGEE